MPPRTGRREPPVGGGCLGTPWEQVSLESPREGAAGAEPRVGTSSQDRLGVYGSFQVIHSLPLKHDLARQAGGSVLSVNL